MSFLFFSFQAIINRNKPDHTTTIMAMMMISLVPRATARAATLRQSGICRRLFASGEAAVDKMHKLFNSQITNEMKASQLYLSASIWCNEQELTGMASFMLKESSEERAHALEMVDFGLKRDITIELEALPAPNAHWESAEALWADCLQAEKANSQALYTLANAAHECQDHAVTTFLMPFHTEQVDAVSDMKTILAKVREEKHSNTGLIIRQLDSELGASVAASGGGGV
jgi:ferritin